MSKNCLHFEVCQGFQSLSLLAVWYCSGFRLRKVELDLVEFVSCFLSLERALAGFWGRLGVSGLKRPDQKPGVV